MKICLLVVENREEIKTEYCKWLVNIAWGKEVQGIKFWVGKRRPIWKMRQEMLKDILKTDFTHVCFVDSDVIPMKEAIKKLAEHNVPIISGVYFDQTNRPVNRRNGMPHNGAGVEELDVLSMGLSLISREVLEKIEYPMPDPIYKPDADIEYCTKIKEAGYKILCDFSITGAHLLSAPF